MRGHFCFKILALPLVVKLFYKVTSLSPKKIPNMHLLGVLPVNNLRLFNFENDRFTQSLTTILYS